MNKRYVLCLLALVTVLCSACGVSIADVEPALQPTDAGSALPTQTQPIASAQATAAPAVTAAPSRRPRRGLLPPS